MAVNFPPYEVRMDPVWRTISFEQITDISSSTELTEENRIATGVVYALVQFTGNAARYRTDGNDPTNAIGHYVAQNGAIEVWGVEDMENFRAIQTGATGLLEVTYFGV